MSNCISLREAILNENEIICTAAVELRCLLVVKRRNYGHQFFNESELTMLAPLIQKLPLTVINKCLIPLPLTVINKCLIPLPLTVINKVQCDIDVNFVL